MFEQRRRLTLEVESPFHFGWKNYFMLHIQHFSSTITNSVITFQAQPISTVTHLWFDHFVNFITHCMPFMSKRSITSFGHSKSFLLRHNFPSLPIKQVLHFCLFCFKTMSHDGANVNGIRAGQHSYTRFGFREACVFVCFFLSLSSFLLSFCSLFFFLETFEN